MSRYACAAFIASLGVCTSAIAGPKSYPSHCDVGETTVFSCSIGRKVASLCASDDIGPSSGRLRYAFGAMGKPELVYPRADTDPRKAFSYGLLAKGDYVRFQSGSISYVIFSHTRPDIGDDEGVVVFRPGRRPVTLGCKDGALGRDGWQPVYKAKLPQDEPGSFNP